ncbi:MAG: elongation factor G [Spirochaetales bacterium]|nr:elongation factor G [Spirochaetales bacterium]
MSITTDSIRNVAIAGHGGTGKTTLLEQILFNGGVISKAESVDSGKTVSDYTDEEIERKLSIHTTLSSVQWKDNHLNFLDTPGSSDFVGEVVAAFRCAEIGLMVVSGSSGVQIETIKLWRRLNNRNMPRIVFLNMMDKDRADYEKALSDLKEKFKVTFVPVTIPIGNGNGYKGMINLIEKNAYLIHDSSQKDAPSDIPADMNDKVEEMRLTMIEAAAEGDDDLIEKYFEAGTLTEDEIRLGLTEGLRANKLVPVLCGSAENNNGIASLLNFLSYAAPSPAAIEETMKMEEGEEKITISPEGPVSAMVYKTSIDQFSGKLSFIKVITGVLKPDLELLNPRAGKKERISKIFKTEGKRIDDVKELVAGDLGLVTKIDSLHTNDTLCDASKEITFDPLHLPQPVHSLAISAASKKEEDKMNQFLNRAAEEDLTFQLNYNKETRETVISGMGELHINIILDKIRDKGKIDMSTRVPRIAYRETITKSADAEYTHKKQSGGHGQYGRVTIQIKPLPRGDYYSFTNAIKGGSISKGYMPGIEKGLHEAMDEGFIAGYQTMDIGITVVDGKEHTVDSSEMSFKLAAKGALKDAVSKAGAVLLEPVMKLSVFAEEQYMGDILSDLSSRRGRVLGQEALGGGISEIDAVVPQAELLSYSIDLRSITSGTASFEMEFDHYSPISGKIAQAVIQASEAGKE